MSILPPKIYYIYTDPMKRSLIILWMRMNDWHCKIGGNFQLTYKWNSKFHRHIMLARLSSTLYTHFMLLSIDLILVPKNIPSKFLHFHWCLRPPPNHPKYLVWTISITKINVSMWWKTPEKVAQHTHHSQWF